MPRTPRKTRRRAILAEAAAIALLFAPLGHRAAAQEPASGGARVVVEETVAAVLKILNQKQVPQDQRRERIENVVESRFDFATMSRLVLARNYRSFTPEQRNEFEKEFKLHLSRSYGSRLDRYEQENVEVTGQRAEPRGDVTVLTKVVGGQFDGVEVHYRLRQSEGMWLVIDVVIEGVSLVSSFRTQFQEVVSQAGPEGLLEKLREKNAAPLEDDVAVAG